MEQKKKIILLAGPTASGKSKLSIKLAKYFNGEIINADSMQVYKEFSILTSRPSLNETKLVNHHLYGMHSVKKKFSTGHWLEMAIKKIEDQWRKGKTPIIVGGTGLYFKALIDGLVKIPEIPISIKNQIKKLHQEIGQRNFFEQLIKLDPLSKKFVVPTDVQRSIRVYEVKKFTNHSLFEHIKKTKSHFNTQVFKKLFINTPKETLHTNIEERVEAMFKEGATKEVEKFLKMKVYRELSANKIIGVKEIDGYFKGKTTIIETKKLITLKTRQYAKRQFTWARGHMKSWKMIYSTNINDLFKKALNKIS